jgi:hypothetical protein
MKANLPLKLAEERLQPAPEGAATALQLTDQDLRTRQPPPRSND